MLKRTSKKLLNLQFSQQLIIIFIIAVVLMSTLVSFAVGRTSNDILKKQMRAQGMQITQTFAGQSKLALLYQSEYAAQEVVKSIAGFPDIEVIELKAEESISTCGLKVSAIQPAHWGARSIFDRRRGVNSYLVESSTPTNTQRVLFTGDTAETKAYEHLDQIDLAVFGIGAYDPWDHMHATPEQAWKMFLSLGARYMLPIHHSTFELSDEPIGEPMHRLTQIAADNLDAIINPNVGEIIVIESPTNEIRASLPDTQPLPKP